jgi:hypothetical protein
MSEYLLMIFPEDGSRSILKNICSCRILDGRDQKLGIPYGNGPPDSMQSGRSLDQLGDYYFPKKVSAPLT